MLEFVSVSLVSEMKPLLINYRFSINIGNKKFVNLACLADILVADDHIKDMALFLSSMLSMIMILPRLL